MTNRLRLFVAAYLKSPNAASAARAAGYSHKTAYSQGQRLLKNVEVRKRIETALQKVELTAALTLEAIRQHVASDALTDPRCLFDEEGNVRPVHELSAIEAMRIGGFEIVMKNATAGDGKIDRVLKVKDRDQCKYVELAAKYFKLLTDVVELHDMDEKLRTLDAGRQRNAANAAARRAAAAKK